MREAISMQLGRLALISPWKHAPDEDVWEALTHMGTQVFSSTQGRSRVESRPYLGPSHDGPSHLSLSHKSELLTLPAVRVGLPDTLDRAARRVALLGGACHAPRLLHLEFRSRAP